MKEKVNIIDYANVIVKALPKLEATMKNLKGCTDYTYFSGKKQMVFLVDKKGIVQAIRVEDYDEQKFIETRRKK